MKKFSKLSLMATLMCCLATPFAFAKATISDQYQRVVDTAYSYFKGAANADQALLEKAFDFKHGHIKMLRKDKETGEQTLKVVPLKEFAGYFKQATKDEWKADIISVDIVDDNMAMVKLNFYTPKTHYIDYLVMHQLNGEWKIVNKTFVAKPNKANK